MTKKFKNSDLKFEIEKHLRADQISLKRTRGMDNFILDINDTGYSYINRSDRDQDFAIMQKIIKENKK